MSIVCPLKSHGVNEHEDIDVLLDYSAGKLDPSRSVPLAKHLAVCPDCSLFLSAQTDLWQTLDVWEPEPVSLDFNRRLWRKIDAANAAPWYRKLAESLRMGAWKPALPLTAAVFLVAAGFMMDHQTSVSMTPGAVNGSGVTVTEAEQVEKTLDDMQLLIQLEASAGNDSAGSKTPNSSTM